MRGGEVVPGLVLGVYRIDAAVGEGGMGSVYRATDTKLHRPVAIKFLSEEFPDPAARERFEREARMASSLNHPHILTVHDTGEFASRQYLVTEFVDGGTLRTWSALGRHTWRQVVELLTGVADAVATAHEAGILHRDIKPDNILVSRSGYAKLADFGLARDAGSGDVTRTRSGVFMGTVPYMSPEQATGQPLDVRSDIFSFGVVLYEALAGRRPFAGDTDVDTLHQIVHAEPPLLDGEIPLPLRAIVEKALEKDRADRYQSMRELTVDLRRLARKPDSAAVTETVAPAKKSRTTWLPWALAAALAVGFGVWSRFRPSGEPENLLAGARFTRLTDFEATNPAVSPDGKFVAFLSNREGSVDVWLSQPSNGNLQNLTRGTVPDLLGPLRDIGFTGDGSQIWIAGTAGTAGKPGRRLQLLPLIGGSPRNFLAANVAEVAWSPDGKRLVYHVFTSGDAMFTADANGENIRPLLEAGPPDDHRHFQAWSQDSRWIYFVRGRPTTRETDLWRIPADGGQPERLTRLDIDVSYPMPIDAHTVVFTAHEKSGAGPWLWGLNLDTRSVRRISIGLEHYAAVGATADGRRLVARVVNSQVSLSSVPILDQPATERDVQPFPLPHARALTPRFAGDDLYYLSSRDGADGLWRHRNGQSVEVWKGSDGALLTPPAIAPDGRTVAIALRRNDKLLWHLIAADGTQPRVLSGDVDARGTASWSPDGKWIASGGSDAGGVGLFKIPVEGGAPVRLHSGPALDPVWSPDGNLIVFAGASVFTDVLLGAVRPDGTPVDLPAINVRREGERVRFLPDGRGFVYMQNPTLAQDFWLLDLATRQSRPLTRLENPATMRTFDVTSDGKRIVFDRTTDNSNIVLIDLPERNR